jgi:GNAT superfamily N-acetyltransferase
VIRPYREEDAVAVEALLASVWPDDATLREISAIHGPDVESRDRWRRTLVFVRAEQILGAATLLASARHPSRYFVVVLVARDVRRRGIGSALLVESVKFGDGRPLLARVRESDPAGIGFLRARGFDVLMRNRVGVVDPNDQRVQAWIFETPPTPVESRASRQELARAHEEAYAAEHATWAPATERSLEESLRLFCGASWLLETACVIRGQGRIAAVAGLHGPPLAPSEAELFLIAGSATGDAAALRAAVAAELNLAQSLGATVSIEADDANHQLGQILDELPALMEPTLLLLSTDAQATAG